MATGTIPVYVIVGDGDKHQIGTLDLALNAESEPVKDGEVKVHLSLDEATIDAQMSDLLSAAADEIRGRARS